MQRRRLILGQVLKSQPRSAAAHLLMGQAQLQAGNLARAEAELVPLAKRKSFERGATDLAWPLVRAKDDRIRARQAFGAALELAPIPVAALNGLVTLDLVEKNFDGARAKVESPTPRSARTTARCCFWREIPTWRLAIYRRLNRCSRNSSKSTRTILTHTAGSRAFI